MRLASSTAFIALGLILAGCGSSGTKGNGEAAKTAAQILADAEAAAVAASSVHVSGSGFEGGSPLDLNLYLVAGKGGRGHLKVNGLSFDIIRVGPTAYFKGDSKFWANFGGGVTTELLKNRWLSEPSGKGDLASFASLTDISQLFEGILGTHSKLTKGPVSTVNGQSVIALIDGEQKGILYISATGAPYPVELVNTGGKGTIIFDQWNKPIPLEPPSSSIDVDKLKKSATG